MYEDTGKNAGHGFTASEIVISRWTKMADAGNTGTAHVLGQWLNPICIEEDLSCDNQLRLAREGLEHYFPNDPSTVTKIWTQHNIYMALDKKGPLFYNAGTARITDVLVQTGGLSWTIRTTHEDPRPEGAGVGGRAAQLSGGQCPVKQTLINAS